MSGLINEKLTSIDFYKNSMSMFLKNSPGMLERCQMFVDILKNLNNSANNVFDWLNIYGPDYEDKLDKDDEITCGWLDLIGEFLGISRHFNKVVEDKDDEGNVIKDKDGNVIYVVAGLKLNDKEFLKYIQATIQKYIFDGTRESLREAYYGTRLLNWDAYDHNKSVYPIKIQKYLSNIKKTVALNDLKIQYVQAKTKINNKDVLMNGVCQILCLGKTDLTDNLKTLFKAGALTIESLGITYIRTDEYTPIPTALYSLKTDPKPSKYYNDETKEMWVYGETQKQ